MANLGYEKHGNMKFQLSISKILPAKKKNIGILGVNTTIDLIDVIDILGVPWHYLFPSGS